MSVVGDKGMYDSFFSAVAVGINDFKNRYPDFVFNYDNLDKSDSVPLFNNFISAYISYSKESRLYVMIDEYDNFANQILSQNFELFKTITGDCVFLKEFYAAIKAATTNGITKTFSFFCIKCGWVGALTPTLGMARIVSPGLFAWGWGRAPTPRQSVN